MTNKVNKYALLLFGYDNEWKVIIFICMNGQTGKLIGDLPFPKQLWMVFRCLGWSVCPDGYRHVLPGLDLGGGLNE